MAIDDHSPDPADDSDEDDAEMKLAFFQELEARHGGPLSYEDLQKWEMRLNDDDGSGEENYEDDDFDDDDDAALGAPTNRIASAVRSTPPSSSSSALPARALPAAGWLTPSTPPQGLASASGLFGLAPNGAFLTAFPADADGADGADGADDAVRRRDRLPAWCAEELDCVVTEPIVNRSFSRREAVAEAAPSSTDATRADGTPPQRSLDYGASPATPSHAAAAPDLTPAGPAIGLLPVWHMATPEHDAGGLGSAASGDASSSFESAVSGATSSQSACSSSAWQAEAATWPTEARTWQSEAMAWQADGAAAAAATAAADAAAAAAAAPHPHSPVRAPPAAAEFGALSPQPAISPEVREATPIATTLVLPPALDSLSTTKLPTTALPSAGMPSAGMPSALAADGVADALTWVDQVPTASSWAPAFGAGAFRRHAARDDAHAASHHVPPPPVAAAEAPVPPQSPPTPVHAQYGASNPLPPALPPALPLALPPSLPPAPLASPSAPLSPSPPPPPPMPMPPATSLLPKVALPAPDPAFNRPATAPITARLEGEGSSAEVHGWSWKVEEAHGRSWKGEGAPGERPSRTEMGEARGSSWKAAEGRGSLWKAVEGQEAAKEKALRAATAEVRARALELPSSLSCRAHLYPPLSFTADLSPSPLIHSFPLPSPLIHRRASSRRSSARRPNSTRRSATSGTRSARG